MTRGCSFSLKNPSSRKDFYPWTFLYRSPCLEFRSEKKSRKFSRYLAFSGILCEKQKAGNDHSLVCATKMSQQQQYNILFCSLLISVSFRWFRWCIYGKGFRWRRRDHWYPSHLQDSSPFPPELRWNCKRGTPSQPHWNPTWMNKNRNYFKCKTDIISADKISPDKISGDKIAPTPYFGSFVRQKLVSYLPIHFTRKICFDMFWLSADKNFRWTKFSAASQIYGSFVSRSFVP